jgi:hypothetical protein
MLKIRCKRCNVELESHPTKTKCCGCENMTTVRDDKITALDLTLVEMISNTTKKQKQIESSFFTPSELEYQESRRNRKVRKMEFEIR